jgi:hypothetical protein
MKLIYVTVLLLLSLTLCRAQNSNDPKRAPDDVYTRQLVSLLTGLQKNPWSGWKTGTEVVRRYLGNSEPALKPFAYVQPDLVFQILEADKLVAVTQVVNGKPYRQEHPVKDQGGADKPMIKTGGATPATLEIDGFTLACLLREMMPSLIFNDGPSFPPSKEWSLASHPTLLLRRESGGTTWEVASVLVTKKIGEREFQCVKTIGKMHVDVDGPMEVITTQYLSPDIPGHLVEEIKEFYKVDKEGRERVPHMIIHQQVMELKLP